MRDEATKSWLHKESGLFEDVGFELNLGVRFDGVGKLNQDGIEYIISDSDKQTSWTIESSITFLSM